MINKSLESELIGKAYTKDSMLTSLLSPDNIFQTDKDGRTLLFHAVLANNFELANWAIENGADVNIKDRLGWVPLHYAAQKYLVEMVEFLIKHGADVNARDEYGNNIIWRAVFASQGRGEVIKILLSNGADPAIKNSHNKSALDVANTIANYDIKPFLVNWLEYNGQ